MGVANCPHCGESINGLQQLNYLDEWETNVPTWACPECCTIIGTSDAECYY